MLTHPWERFQPPPHLPRPVLRPFLRRKADYIKGINRKTAMLLSVRNLQKSFPREDGIFPVLNGVSLDLDTGETMALTGESGSGKSTLLHLIGGLDHADQGEIVINGTALGPLDDVGRAAFRRGTIGLIFQQFNLIPSLNVADNLAFQARLAKRHDPAWIKDLTARLGLADFARQYPENLSGGQQQRVAIGRALAARPALLLADEPTGNLDEDTSATVMDLMRDLVAETGAGILMVTHSERLAATFGRRIHLTGGRVS